MKFKSKLEKRIQYALMLTDSPRAAHLFGGMRSLQFINAESLASGKFKVLIAASKNNQHFLMVPSIEEKDSIPLAVEAFIELLESNIKNKTSVSMEWEIDTNLMS